MIIDGECSFLCRLLYVSLLLIGLSDASLFVVVLCLTELPLLKHIYHDGMPVFLLVYLDYSSLAFVTLHMSYF